MTGQYYLIQVWKEYDPFNPECTLETPIKKYSVKQYETIEQLEKIVNSNNKDNLIPAKKLMLKTLTEDEKKSLEGKKTKFYLIKESEEFSNDPQGVPIIAHYVDAYDKISQLENALERSKGQGYTTVIPVEGLELKVKA